MGMEMGDRVHVGPRLEHFEVDRQFARQFIGCTDLVAVEIAEQKIFRMRGFAEFVRCHQDHVRILGACTDMAEPVNKAAPVKKPPRHAQFLPEDFFAIDHCDPTFCALLLVICRERLY